MRLVCAAVLALAVLTIGVVQVGASKTDVATMETDEVTVQIHCVSHDKSATATIRLTSHSSHAVTVNASAVFYVVGQGERAHVDLRDVRVRAGATVVRTAQGFFDRPAGGRVSCRVDQLNVRDSRDMRRKPDRCALRALATSCGPRP
jgi:hypothetical protein